MHFMCNHSHTTTPPARWGSADYCPGHRQVETDLRMAGRGLSACSRKSEETGRGKAEGWRGKPYWERGGPQWCCTLSTLALQSCIRPQEKHSQPQRRRSTLRKWIVQMPWHHWSAYESKWKSVGRNLLTMIWLEYTVTYFNILLRLKTQHYSSIYSLCLKNPRRLPLTRKPSWMCLTLNKNLPQRNTVNINLQS